MITANWRPSGLKRAPLLVPRKLISVSRAPVVTFEAKTSGAFERKKLV